MMEEINKEMFYTAKLYMDKLSNGIDPIENVEIPDDSVLNNIALCRTFNFVSSVLDEVIRNNFMISIPNSKKKKFSITEKQRSRISISDTPVKLTAISHRIERVLPPDVKTISSIKMSQWLENEGLLSGVIKDGRVRKEATTAGNELGIETKIVKQGDREFASNFYDANAQAFIIANLEAISRFRQV